MTSKTPRVMLTKNPIQVLDLDFLEAQKKFFNEFVKIGFEDLFDEINPVSDYTGQNWEVSFEKVEWGEIKTDFKDAQNLGLTHDSPVYVTAKLVNKRTGEIKKQKLFVCDMPMMSERASFMVNGNERVIVFQIIRSEGILFTESKKSSTEKRLYSVKLMPQRGKWFAFEVNKYGVMSVKLLDKKPRVLLTTLLRAFGYSSDEEITKILSVADTTDFKFVEATLKKDVTKSTEEALIDIYRKLRPEDSITIENARNFIESMFFNKRRFFLGKVGRYKLNQKLYGGDTKEDSLLLTKHDVIAVIQDLIRLNNGTKRADDIDSLVNRRVRGINEIVAEKIRVGLVIMEKNIKDRMSAYSTDENITPAMVVNSRPVIAAINQFFGSSQLLRYMDQQNILAEIEIKRKVSAGGPKGLTKERATFSVRDVHNTHYSKLCPVTTPEGQNVGLASHLAIYAKINDFGFLEAPYYRIYKYFDPEQHKDIKDKFIGRIVKSSLEGLKEGKKLTKESIEKITNRVELVHFVNNEVEYLDADAESKYILGGPNIKLDENKNILEDFVYARNLNGFTRASTNDLDFIDVDPVQIAGADLALIPFAKSDDPQRTFYGTKTQNQAVPLIKYESPIVGTGFEKTIAKASGRTLFAKEDGEVIFADASMVKLKYINGETQTYVLDKFMRTNQNTTFNQVCRVLTGDKFKKDDVIVDGPSTEFGEIALGINLRVAYMVWDGYNFEDGIILSERLIKDDLLTSVHIHEYTQDIRETKLGDEEMTRDIPNVGEKALRNLGEDGLVRIGASVEAGDILVGIIAPKGESELSAEEKLLRAIFGEYARDVRDNSLRVPHGEEGVVIDVQVLDKQTGAKLDSGVLKQIRVRVARTHKISIGDKLTGFHGEKGLIAKIVPENDMPFDEEGRAVDIILGPQSMIRRMNLGVLIETHVGGLARKLGVNATVQQFSDYSLQPLLDMAKERGIKHEEKITLFDGRTGRKYDQKVAVGYKHVLKLDHLADSKVHARSTGPYTLVTQQPLRGKAQMGGQRLGEMEVWALQAHVVPNLLHEMLTIKSDDVVGRASAYKSIITNQPIQKPTIPESFNVLDKELAGLGIKLEKIDEKYDETKQDMSLEEIVDTVGS